MAQMDPKYAPLFTPWKIGNVEIKNRIVMTSMGGTSLFGWMEPNHFDKEAARFLLERARNNAGLILPGIAPSGTFFLASGSIRGRESSGSSRLLWKNSTKPAANFLCS